MYMSRRAIKVKMAKARQAILDISESGDGKLPEEVEDLFSLINLLITNRITIKD